MPADDLLAAIGLRRFPDFPRAACRGTDPDVFFVGAPTRRKPSESSLVGLERREEQAMRLCSGCEHRVDCYRAARARGEQYGIWGGVNFERKEWAA